MNILTMIDEHKLKKQEHWILEVSNESLKEMREQCTAEWLVYGICLYNPTIVLKEE